MRARIRFPVLLALGILLAVGSAFAGHDQKLTINSEGDDQPRRAVYLQFRGQQEPTPIPEPIPGPIMPFPGGSDPMSKDGGLSGLLGGGGFVASGNASQATLDEAERRIKRLIRRLD